jgi:hypothetical protein
LEAAEADPAPVEEVVERQARHIRPCRRQKAGRRGARAANSGGWRRAARARRCAGAVDPACCVVGSAHSPTISLYSRPRLR